MENEFRCLECGDHQLEEVMKDVVVRSECSIDACGQLHYHDQTNEDGEVVHYECSNGHIVKDEKGETITDPEVLAEFLGNHPVLSYSNVINLIADRLRQLSPDELAKEYNLSYPNDELKHIGEQMFVRGNPEVEIRRV